MSIMKISAIILFVFGLIGYSLFNSRIFIAGPQITIQEPQNGALIEEKPLIEVSGLAENIAYLRLNGRQIYTDENSFFEEALLLNPGYNIIQLEAEDKFGRGIKKIIEVVYDGDFAELENDETDEDDIINVTDELGEIQIEEIITEDATTTATSSEEI